MLFNDIIPYAKDNLAGTVKKDCHFEFNNQDQYLKTLDEILQNYKPVSLEEMNSIDFLDRMDTKFVFHANRLLPLLASATDFYKILMINNKRLFRYKTLYFDTPVLKFYHDHHNGKRKRFKIRLREYRDTGQAFLEIKEKTNKDRTVKHRIKAEGIKPELTEGEISYIRNYINIEPGIQIKSVLLTSFSRLSLVSNDFKERVTIDLNLEFEGYARNHAYPFLAICEVKKDRSSLSGQFISILKKNKIRPLDLSKYGFGTVSLNPNVKYNNFKDRILTINKLSNDS